MIATVGVALIASSLHAADDGAGKILSRDVLVEGGGYFPVLIQLKNGDLMAAVRGGAPHVGKLGSLDLITSRDQGKTWSKPRALVNGPDDDRNPAFGQLSDGTLLLAYVILRGYGDDGLKFAKSGRFERIFDGVYLIRSEDNGRTWSPAEMLEPIRSFYAGKGAVSPYGKIIQLGDGTVLMSVYFEFEDEGRGNESYVVRSPDRGKTWSKPILIAEHFNETALTELPDGRVIAALRSQKGGHLATSFSSDGGLTWNAPQRITDDREHPADLIVLKDGRLLMTYGVRNKPMGAAAITSKDNGRTWDKEGKIILEGGAPNTDCGYPSSVQLQDGSVVTLYYQVDDPNNALATAKCKKVIWQP